MAHLQLPHSRFVQGQLTLIIAWVHLRQGLRRFVCLAKWFCGVPLSLAFNSTCRVVRFNTKSCQASSLAARQSDAYSRRTYGFVLMVNSVRASACSANPTAVLVLQASPSVGHVAQRAASTSGLSDVEMAEQLDDIMAGRPLLRWRDGRAGSADGGGVSS